MLEHSGLPTNLQQINQQDFGILIESHRHELCAHCYRMLGSLQEAEEMVQETFLRAWNRRETYEGRSTFRAWLYKISTNLCLDLLRKRPRRSLPIAREKASTLEQPIPASIMEPVWLEPFPDDSFPAAEQTNPEVQYSANESISLAFLTILHILPPRQRAALILSDVLDWQANEIANVFGQTVSSVKSSLHRARTTLANHQTEKSEELSIRLTDDQLRDQLDRYVRAWETADVEELVSLLKDDNSTFSMPPIPSWYRGREVIRGLVGKTIFSGSANGRWRLLATHANRQPAFGLYKLNEGNGNHDAYGIQVVTFDGNKIVDIITFRSPALVTFFNLPPTLIA